MSEPLSEKKVFVHIVLYNSYKQHGAKTLKQTLTALFQQTGFEIGKNLEVVVRDNASSDAGLDFLKHEFPSGIKFIALSHNYGFAAGQNFAVYDFLSSDFDYLLILNPDIRLASDALLKMVENIEGNQKIGMVTPKMLRADEKLEPQQPLTLDATGMVLTKALRHFDRGSGEADINQYQQAEEVFGGSGACLLVKRACVEDLLLDSSSFDASAERIFPQLKFEKNIRLPFFDEAFFAYREDADLAWRTQLYAWDCRYVPEAVTYHRRVVLPSNREKLPAELNCHSVRNRFLLQLNNYSLEQSLGAFFGGVVVRNLLVLAGVIIKERTSLRAFKEVAILFKRSLVRRRLILAKAKERGGIEQMKKWFI